MLTICRGFYHMMWLLVFRHFPSNHDQLILLAVKCSVIHYLFSLLNTAPRFDLIDMDLIVFERFKFTQIYLKKFVLHIIVGEGLVYERGTLDFHTFVRKINDPFLQWLESQRVFIVKDQPSFLLKLQLGKHPFSFRACGQCDLRWSFRIFLYNFFFNYFPVFYPEKQTFHSWLRPVHHSLSVFPGLVRKVPIENGEDIFFCWILAAILPI